MKKILIDCDPGVDDALALFLATSLPQVKIMGISSVAGNVGIETTTRNVQLLSSLLQLDCPLVRGAAAPLVKNLEISQVHGEDGIGGALNWFQDVQPKPLSDKSALDFMRDFLYQSSEPITIVALGPLTNIALLLKAYPEVRHKIQNISIMGGSLQGGNVTACSEFNFYTDPEAAKIVLDAEVPITLVGLNVTLQATLTQDTLAHIEGLNTVKSKIGRAIFKGYAKADPALHDPCAILAITHPEIFTFQDMKLQIDTRDGVTRGMSYPHGLNSDTKNFNCKVALTIDHEKFQQLMLLAFQ